MIFLRLVLASGRPTSGLLKLAEEKYHKDIIPTFYSKDYKPTSGDSPKPVLVISYRNQNGLENYRDINGDRVENIKIINESYETYLKTQSDSSFDVVYFDPMFKEPNKKSTSINSFRDFAAHSTLTNEIIREAIRVCKKRVVIKERRGINNFEDLGIEKVYGGKKKGSIIYGIIKKHIID